MCPKERNKEEKGLRRLVMGISKKAGCVSDSLRRFLFLTRNFSWVHYAGAENLAREFEKSY
jgi:hypothetical protein